MYGQLQEDGKVEVEEGKTLGEDGEGHSKDDSKTQGKDESKAEIDIEAEIRREVEDLKTSKGRGEAFTGIRLDVQCGECPYISLSRLPLSPSSSSYPM